MKKDLKVVQRCYYWIVSVVIVSETWIRPLDSASHHHSNRNTRNNPSPSSTQFRKRNSNQKLAKKYPFESYWEKSTNRRRKPKNRETLAVPGKKGGELRFQSIDFFCSDSNCKIKRKKKKKKTNVCLQRERGERDEAACFCLVHECSHTVLPFVIKLTLTRCLNSVKSSSLLFFFSRWRRLSSI